VAQTFIGGVVAAAQSGAATFKLSGDAGLPPLPIVRIHLFGSMRATSYLGDDVLPRAKKARAILAYLCLVSGARSPRTRIASMLWDRVSEAQARTSFRRALSDLTLAMGPLAEELISIGRGTVRLNTYLCWIDALALLKSPSDSTRDDLAALCNGELLDGLDEVSAAFDEWLTNERVRFKERFGEAGARRTSIASLAGEPVPVPGRLRVGVLPLDATDCEHEPSLTFSLSHEIAAGLARFRWFDVLTPSALRFASTRANLDYIIDGSISGSGEVVRITVRLLRQAQPVWSEQFNILLSELHRLNELVTVRIVARIDPVILHIEGRSKQRARYGATGLLLQAIPKIFSMQREQYELAGQLITRALALEPDNPTAHAWAAHWHLFYIGQGWATDVDRVSAMARQHAGRAIDLDPENAEALGIYAHSCSRRVWDFDKALFYFDRALRLNPSLAFNWALSAATYCYIGQPDEALRRLERYRELAPADLYFSWFETLYTIAYTFKGDYELAVIAGRRAVEATPSFVAGYKPLIASLGHLGRHDEAQVYIRKLLSLEPNFTVEKFGKVYSIKQQSDRDRYMEGLRLAGVPER